MKKIQVITQKELVQIEKLTDCTAVVIDVFLATSTIIFLLKNNYEPIYAMKDVNSAREFLATERGDYLKLGESKGKSIAGFLYPDPTLIKQTLEQKPAVICSTNGTRAIEKAKHAKRLYISSLINGHAIAERIHSATDRSSIVIICSGNDNRFSLEDFVGAGQIIDHLVAKGDYILSDSANVALTTYEVAKKNAFKNLLDSETTALLRSVGFTKASNFILEHIERINIVPTYSKNKIINETVEIDKRNFENTLG